MSNQNLTPGNEGKISVEEAAKLTANWRSYVSASHQRFNTNAFLIPITSITNLLAANPDAEGVRAYLGLANPDDPNSGKLVLAAVVKGEDVIYVPKTAARGENDGEGGGGEVGDEGGEGDDSNLYDLTTPCPPLCSNHNPLNPG